MIYVILYYLLIHYTQAILVNSYYKSFILNEC